MGARITTKKVKVIGKEEYVNASTGEVQTMNVISIEERDFNFHKLWLQNILNSIELIGNQKTKLAFWIIENISRDNLLVATYDVIVKRTGVSKDTVKKTMKILLDSDFLEKVQPGVYRVNPNVIFKGTRQNRMNVLIQYKDTERINQEKSLKNTVESELPKLTVPEGFLQPLTPITTSYNQPATSL